MNISKVYSDKKNRKVYFQVVMSSFQNKHLLHFSKILKEKLIKASKLKKKKKKKKKNSISEKKIHKV